MAAPWEIAAAEMASAAAGPSNPTSYNASVGAPVGGEAEAEGGATRGGRSRGKARAGGDGGGGGGGRGGGRGGRRAEGSTARGGRGGRGRGGGPGSRGGVGRRSRTSAGTATGRGSRGGRGGRGRGRGRGRGGRGAAGSAAAADPRSTARGRQASGSVAVGDKDGLLAPNPRSKAGEGSDDEDAEDKDDDDDEEGATLDETGEDLFARQEALDKERREQMGVLLQAMNPEQYDRHEAYRRSTLNRVNVRRLVNHVLSQSVTPQIAMIAAGVGKVYVGEMVELARQVQARRGDSGALQPSHLLEAHRLYKLSHERLGRLAPGAPHASAGAPGVGKRRRLF